VSSHFFSIIFFACDRALSVDLYGSLQKKTWNRNPESSVFAWNGRMEENDGKNLLEERHRESEAFHTSSYSTVHYSTWNRATFWISESL
jgi:hypothetical protein